VSNLIAEARESLEKRRDSDRSDWNREVPTVSGKAALILVEEAERLEGEVHKAHRRECWTNRWRYSKKAMGPVPVENIIFREACPTCRKVHERKKT